ncbi:MAG: Wzz/FepE/Etk N-terminal domain-containing protein, partial [Acidimicrobiales bacterium]
AVTLARVTRPERGPLALLELGAPGVAAELALNLAKELAEDGPVVVVDDLPGRDVGKLPVQGDVRVLEAGDAAIDAASRRIGVGTVAPGTAWTDLEYLGTEAVLVVRSGHANTLWLHTVARQLADCRIPIAGVVLVDPDPKDHTDGTLWDGLHTALRGRASAVAAKQVADGEKSPAVHATAERVSAETSPRKFVEQQPERPIDWPVEPPGGRTVVVPRETDAFDAPTRRFHPIAPQPSPAVSNGNGHQT